jgi:hypothetical protein
MKIIPKDLLFRHLAQYGVSLKKYPEKYLHLIFNQIPEGHEHMPYVCPICTINWVMIDRNGYHASSEFTEDHFPPESVGGKSKILVCKKCNSEAGKSYEASLRDKIAHVSFKKRLPNSTIKTSSIITNLKGWHHGSLSIDDTGQMGYQVKNKGKQKLPALSAWEQQTNNAGKGWEMQVTIKAPSEEKVAKGLLKAAYLYSFATLGYDFVYSQTGELIRHSLNDISSYPIKVGWLWLDFETKIHEGPDIPEGLCFIHTPKQLQSLVVNLPMKLKENNYGCMVPILIPDPTPDGKNNLIKVQEIFENNPSQTVSFVPVYNNFNSKDENCYSMIWDQLKNQYK